MFARKKITIFANTQHSNKTYQEILQQIRRPSQSTRPQGGLQWMHPCLGQAMKKRDTCLSPFQAFVQFPWQWQVGHLYNTETINNNGQIKESGEK